MYDSDTHVSRRVKDGRDWEGAVFYVLLTGATARHCNGSIAGVSRARLSETIGSFEWGADLFDVLLARSA